MRKFVFSFAALFAAVFAKDYQLTLNMSCTFHVVIRYKNTFDSESYDTYGVLNGSQVVYLKQFVHAPQNYTRVIRWDIRDGEHAVYWKYTSSPPSCDDGFREFDEYYRYLKNSYVWSDSYDVYTVACPEELPSLAGKSCKSYEATSLKRVIVCESMGRIVYIEKLGGGVFFDWKDDEIDMPSSKFDVQLCNGAMLTAPKVCDGASVATVAKSLLALVLLLALII